MTWLLWARLLFLLGMAMLVAAYVWTEVARHE
jgi:hypothetical protein